jgi:hypothetical protein
MPTPSDHRFPGFASPSFTQVPDELFDALLPTLADCELRVLLYIVRRTFGFKRDADTISLSQLVSGITTRDGQVLDRGTGLSKATVARGLKGLRDKGVIDAHRNRSASRGDEPTTYRLRFKQGSTTSEPIHPLSHQQDGPRVSTTRRAVSQPRDTQQTVEQETETFEYSKGNDFGDKTEPGQGYAPDRARPHTGQSGLPAEAGRLATILSQRARRDVGREDRTAIAAAIERFADELGDQADPKISVSRAVNLFRASGTGRDTFIDALFRARGETLDRRNYPGKAPRPANLMAYFFAVVEDRLGRKAAALDSTPLGGGR